MSSMATETRIDSVYVLDTHAIIWYSTDDIILGQQAVRVFNAAERDETRLLISAISIAEIYYANKKHHWYPDFKKFCQEVVDTPFFELIPFNPHDTIQSDELAAVPEMHDRIIAGLAVRLGVPLISSDLVVTGSQLVRIVW